MGVHGKAIVQNALRALRKITCKLQKSDGQNAAVLCKNHRKRLKFELARLKKKKEKLLAVWRLSGLVI